MATAIEARLDELGITLPDAPAPAANYVPYVIAGSLLFVSGQIAQDTQGPLRGKLGMDFDVEAGAAAARACALSLIAQARAAVGDLDRIKRVVKLTGFVNSTPDFADHPRVINGASDLFVEVFAEKGRHARAAVGSSSLPFGVAVEIEGIFELA